MKKFLLLLVSVFFTISTYGQTNAKIDYSQVNTVTKVGDTLTVKFKYEKASWQSWQIICAWFANYA